MSAEVEKTVPTTSRTLRIRPMRTEDVQGVSIVEKGSYVFPWSEGIFRDCIRVGYICRVIECEGVVVGYGIMSMGAGEAHILNLCIRTDLRRRGLGRRLLELLLNHARSGGMQHAFLEVRPSNPGAIQLYESEGFERIGLRKGYYQAVGGREDAVVYRLTLGP